MFENKLVVVVAVVAAGCGTDAPPVDDPPAPPFTQAQARLAGEALAAGVEDAAAWFGPVAPAPSLDASCVTTSGDITDADSDSIPANAVFTLDCTKRRLGFTGVATGTETIVDTQPGALAWAFTADVDLHASLTGPFGGNAVTDSVGSIVASQASGIGPYVLTSALDVATTITNVSGKQTPITETVEAAIAFAPRVAWTPGGIAVTGELAVDGSWQVAVDDAGGAATLATPAPLVLSPGCASLITAGTLEASFVVGASTATIAVTWTACGQSDVTYEPGV